MENSIFQNFSVDHLQSGSTSEVGLGITPHLFLLLNDALKYCGTSAFDANGKWKQGEIASNESVRAISESLNSLSKLALTRGGEIFCAGFQGISKNAEDCSVFELALDELGGDISSEVSFLQINGFAALSLIDCAITSAKNDEPHLKFFELLSEAALYLSQAASCQKDLYRLFAEHNEAVRKDDEFVKLQSARSSKNAEKRHQNDPKQAEKLFIFECWKIWQNKPEQYKSKAEFARSMIEKGQHLLSHKTIENWCTQWEKEN